MNKNMFLFLVNLSLWAGLLLPLPKAVAETTSDYQAAIQAEAGLVHHYSFDGADNRQRRADKKGSADFIEFGIAATPGYGAAGFDGTSDAVTVSSLTNGFQTGSVVDLDDRAITIEMIFRSDDATADSHIFQGYDGGGTYRSYFAIQNIKTGADLFTTVGSSWPGNYTTALGDGAMTIGHWYFYAATYEISGGGTNVTVYIADLTNGDVDLTSSSSTPASSYYTASDNQFTLGSAFWDATLYKFNGAIDELAVFNGAQSAATLDSHFAILTDRKTAYMPVPSSGTTDADPNVVLSWQPWENAVAHNVYFGTDPANLPLVSQGQTETSYDPCGVLELYTMYYWRVEEVDPCDNVWPGSLWNFSTGDFGDLTVMTGSPGTLLHRYLMGQANAQFAARDAAVQQALASQAGVQQRQQQLNADYLEILGYFPEKTPLNPVVTGTTLGDNYKIEKVVFESHPGFYVTANLYIPTTGSGPWPGVLVTCGHSHISKAYSAYQHACILLVKNGFVALIVDTVSQGERFQFLDGSGQPNSDVKAYYYAHTIYDMGSILVGSDTVGYEAWDNIRGIDYLFTRSEVDPSKKVGLTGNSGGGTQTTFGMPLDDRIGPAAPSCFISSRESLLARGVNDGCQHLPGEGAKGIEEVDYITMRAPKPTMILAAEHDYFKIGAARDTFAEAKQIYTVLGESDKVDMFEYPDGHGFSKPRREAMVRFMRRWLWNDNRPVTEGSQTLKSEADLQVTATGQVGSNFSDAVTIQELNLKRACDLAGQRKSFWADNSKAACIDEVKSLIGFREGLPRPTVQVVDTIDAGSFSIEKLIINRTDEVPIPALLCLPNNIKGQLPAIIYVDSRGKDTDVRPGGPIVNLVQQNNIVLSIDVRGFGETRDVAYSTTKNAFENVNDEYRNGVLAQHIGRVLLGQRAEDVVAALDILLARADVDPDAISITGIERTGPVALHAAAIDQRFTAGVTMERSIVTWLDLLLEPLAFNQIAHVVPFALTRYDLQDLINSIEPRPVHIVDPADAYGVKR